MKIRLLGSAALALTIVGACAAGLACGSSQSSSGFVPGEDSGAGSGLDGGGGGDGSLYDGPRFGGDGAMASSLVIQPPSIVITVAKPGPTVTQPFKAIYNGSSSPASWSIDLPLVGTVASSGIFSASGAAGGIATVTAQVGSLTATAKLTVVLDLTDNPGMVPVATQGQLKGGGSADATFKWLYPYDATIFPRGLTSPVLQFAGTAADFVYVQATTPTLSYQGFFGPSNPDQATLPAASWSAIAESAGAKDSLKVQVTKISGGQVTGPITENWTIAQGALKGTVYYNSYDSALGGSEGTVLKMKPGTPASVLVGGAMGCQVCHAVSSDGSTLTDSNGSYTSGNSFALAASGATMTYTAPTSVFSFAGLYPDGTLTLTNAALSGSWPPNVPGVGLDAARVSQLLNTKTGAVIPAPGFDGVVGNALMPTFSPDGKKVVFNHYDTGMGHSLAYMSFNLPTKTFSGLTDVVTDPAHFLGWPAFLPDSAEFIFHADSGSDYATWQMHTADLSLVDLATKTVTPLDALNGMKNGAVYLPYGASEAHMNYEPTSLPVAVGGYYWVVFTSRREYGNTITATDPWQTGPAIRKKLWVAAIDLNPKPGTDPSHPAFYINDQELAAGNMRGFWALDPCEQNGNSCSSGDECCTGFCRQVNGDAGAQLVCIPPPMGCAQEYEKCTVTADCCGASMGYQCINGFCAQPSVQ